MRTLILLVIVSLGCLAAADTGRLKTEVDPGRAGVFVDGKYVGPAANFKIARTYDVSPGEHDVRLVELRYEDFVAKVTISADKKTVLKAKLKSLPPAKPPFGRLRTHPDHFAAVYVNEHYMGHVDEFSSVTQGLLLNPGTYQIKIVPVNGQNQITKTVTIEADKTVLVK